MGDRQVGYIKNTVEESTSGLPRTNPDSGRVEDLNHAPPDFESSAINHSAMRHPLEILPNLSTFSAWDFVLRC